MFHSVVEGTPDKIAPYVVFIILLIWLGYDQMKLIDLKHLHPEWLSLVYTVFPSLCGAGILISLLFACKNGGRIEEACKNMEEIHRLQEQLLSK